MKQWIARINILAVSAILVWGTSISSVNAATDTEINTAISKGLAWLATQQNVNGSFGSGYTLTHTATALLAFENEGHFPGGGTLYSEVVEKGLDYIFRSHAYKIGVTVQWAGNPDTDGDGIGVYFNQTRACYETGMVMQAIIASNTPNRVVTEGACINMTYHDVVVDMVDYIAWSQCDGGSGRGGWRYYPFNNVSDWSDNSVSQWPVLGLVAAEQWGIYAPQFVKTELEIWVNTIQYWNPGDYYHGASGYDFPTVYRNISKTGGLLVELKYIGYDNSYIRAEAALEFINKRWNIAPYGTWYGNRGHSYAMFSVFKGLELMEISTIPSAPANAETPAGDWWGDYCEFLVASQIHPNSDVGYWNGYSYWNQWMSTAWYIVILQATVFPVQVAVELPECACDTGYDVTVNYSIERFAASGVLELYENGNFVADFPIDNFQGSASITYPVGSDTPGNNEWVAVLNVTSSGGINSNITDASSLDVCETPIVADIADQFAPFIPVDLSYLPGAEWTVTGVPEGWTVTIEDGMATVDAGESVEPATLTFTASTSCCDGVVCSSFDDATFTPIKLVAFDVKPCSWPNPFNVKANGVLPVAILGSEDLDVTQIDPTTLLLEGVEPLRWCIEDVVGIAGDDVCNDIDEGPDGYDDLTVKFEKQAIVAALGEVSDGDELIITITGNLYSGLPIEGDDCIIILKKGKMKKDEFADNNIPDVFALGQNYPNPFNPVTTIRYQLPEASFVTLKVFDVLGKEVAVLVNTMKNAGYHSLEFSTHGLSSGVYVYRITAGNFVDIKKMIINK